MVKTCSCWSGFRARICCTIFCGLTALHATVSVHVTWLASPRSEAQAHVCLPVHGDPWWVLLQHSIMLWLFFIVECGIPRFSVLSMYPKFGHHPHPLGYLCAKFSFFCSLQCWASSWRKIVDSVNQSPSLFDAPGTEMEQLPTCVISFGLRCLRPGFQINGLTNVLRS